MLKASERRLMARPFAAALTIAVAACSSAPSPTPEPLAMGGATASLAGSGGLASAHGGSPQVAGGTAAGGSAGGAPSAAGGSGSSAGASAAGASSGGAGAAGSAGALGGGGASGASGAGASGASSGPVYSTDPKTFGGAVRCDGFDVCESFETTALGALPAGFTLEGYGTRQVGVSTDRAMRGTHSLKLDIAAQTAVTGWLTRVNLGSLAAHHYGRAFFRIDAPAPTEFVHFDLFQGVGPYQGHDNLVRFTSTGTGAGTQPSNWSFIYNVQPDGGQEFGTEGDRSAHPRVDDWMCLEWSFDSSKQRAQYYLDGAAIEYLNIDTERAEIPVFDSVSVGFGKYQKTGAFVLYLDELALDGDRIGCNN